MDDNGTKVLSKQHPPVPPNRVIPEMTDVEFQQLIEDRSKSEAPKFDDFEGIQRQELAPLVKEILQTVIPKVEKTIEGMVLRYNEQNDQYYEGEYFIVINQQHLSLHEGGSKEGKLLH